MLVRKKSDIAHVVYVVSRFFLTVVKSIESHQIDFEIPEEYFQIKKLEGFIDFELVFERFIDFEVASYLDHKIHIWVFVHFLGSVVPWQTELQECVCVMYN